MKLGEIVLEGKACPDWAVIYIVKDINEILYIGRSEDVGYRLAQHLGYADPPSTGEFSEYARASIPACWQWDVEFVIVPDNILEEGNRINYWIKQTEAKLIQKLQPKYNKHYK